MTTITAKVIADSIHDGHRLTTLELHYPRIILAELNTHRMFSRNTASSRAIPVSKIMENVIDDPYIPVIWQMNQPGMFSTTNASDEVSDKATEIWLDTMQDVISGAKKLSAIGIHKQFVNRLLEPFGHVNTVLSSTEWDNFFKLRIAPDAQPEIRILATEIKKAIDNSKPVEMKVGEWHIPYILDEEREKYDIETLKKISTSRLARTSYFSHTTKKLSAPEEDIPFHDRLDKNGHYSPFEHIATPSYRFNSESNFKGWAQYRKFREHEKAGLL